MICWNARADGEQFFISGNIPGQSFNLVATRIYAFRMKKVINADRVAFYPLFRCDLFPARLPFLHKNWNVIRCFERCEFGVQHNWWNIFLSRAHKFDVSLTYQKCWNQRNFRNEKCCPVTLKIYRPLVLPLFCAFVRNHSIHSCESILIDRVQFNLLLFDYWWKSEFTCEFSSRHQMTITLK